MDPTIIGFKTIEYFLIDGSGDVAQVVFPQHSLNPGSVLALHKPGMVFIPVIPTLRRQRQEGQEFTPSLATWQVGRKLHLKYCDRISLSPCLAWNSVYGRLALNSKRAVSSWVLRMSHVATTPSIATTGFWLLSSQLGICEATEFWDIVLLWGIEWASVLWWQEPQCSFFSARHLLWTQL